MDKSLNIAYRTLTQYLTPSSTYEDAVFSSILAAEDLYGICSEEVVAVRKAWKAVGLGEASELATAKFEVDKEEVCSTDIEFIFTNNSENSDSYLWNFGDGTESTEENPVHQYTSNGEFDVQLIVYSTTAECITSDTVFMEKLVTVIDVGLPEVCEPNTITSFFYQVDLVSFSLDQDTAWGDSEEKQYENYGCSKLFYANALSMGNFDFVVQSNTEYTRWANISD